jgi:hypothetical protein
MGKDKVPKAPASATGAAGASAAADGKKGGSASGDGAGAGIGRAKGTEEKKPIARGHRQRGAGTVITAKPAMVTDDGIVVKPHERLPSTMLREFCQREKRPMPIYRSVGPGLRVQVVLPDARNSKNDLTFLPPVQDFESPKVANDTAALLAMWHFQKNLPLERKLPEPFASTWLSLLASTSAAGSVTSGSSASSSSSSSSSASSSSAATASNTKTPAREPETDTTTAASIVSKAAVSVPKTTTNKSSESAAASTSADSRPAKPAGPSFTVVLKDNSRQEREAQEKILERKRRRTFFDALKLANKLSKVFLSSKLKKEIEAVLGLADRSSSTHAGNSFSISASNYSDKLDELLTNVQSASLTLPGDSSVPELTPSLQHRAIIRHVIPQLQAQGFHLFSICESLYSVFSNAGNAGSNILEEVQTVFASSKTNESRLTEIFGSSVAEACLEYLCLHLDEEDLPSNMDGKGQEAVKSLEVYSTANRRSNVRTPDIRTPTPTLPSGQSASQNASQPLGFAAEDESIAAAMLLSLLENPMDRLCAQTLHSEQGWPLRLCAHAVKFARCIFVALRGTDSGSSDNDELDSSYIRLISNLLLLLAGATCAASNNFQLPPDALALLKQHVTAISSGAQSSNVETITGEVETLEAIFVDTPIHTEHTQEHRFTTVSLPQTSLTFTFANGVAYPDYPPLCSFTSNNNDTENMKLMFRSVALFTSSLGLKDELMLYSLCLRAEELNDEDVPAQVLSNFDFDSLLRSMSTCVQALAAQMEITWAPTHVPSFVETTVPPADAQTETETDTTDLATEMDSLTFASSNENDSASLTSATSSFSSASSGSRGPHSKASYTHPFWTRTAPSRSPAPQKLPGRFLETRRNLPAWNSRDELIRLLDNRRSIVV